MWRRGMLVVVAAAVGVGGAIPAVAASGRARLTVMAPASMPFVTIGLSPGQFTGDRIWQNLKPGTYVVVQAPPVPGVLHVECSNGDGPEITLDVGEDVTCVFSVS